MKNLVLVSLLAVVICIGGCGSNSDAAFAPGQLLTAAALNAALDVKVPYTGAMGDVDLGHKWLYAQDIAARDATYYPYFQTTVTPQYIGFATPFVDAQLATNSTGDGFVFTTDNGSGPVSTTFPNVVAGTPASATATGVKGTVKYDNSYIYICTATNTWKRASIATW